MSKRESLWNLLTSYTTDSRRRVADPSFDKDQRKEEWISKVRRKGMSLGSAPEHICQDKDIVLAAIRQDVRALQYASPLLQGDKEFILKVVQENGVSLKHVTGVCKNDKEVVTAAAKQYVSSHIKYSKQRRDYDYWMSAVQKDRWEFQRAPDQFQNDKKIVLAAVQNWVGALRFVSPAFQNDYKIVLATVRQNGKMLEHAGPLMKSNKTVVLAALQQNTESLKFASSDLKDDKYFIYQAIQEDALALRFASSRLKNDKDVALLAVRHGRAIAFVSKELQRDKDVALMAVQHNPDNIKHVHESLQRHPDVLIAAGMFDAQHDTTSFSNTRHDKKNTVKMVLSTRFALKRCSNSQATNFTKLLKAHPYIQSGGFVIYAPNAFDKKSCDQNWTDFHHPCRGTSDTCLYQNVLTANRRPTDDCCWRYSFRFQLQEAKNTGGFMLQLIEKERDTDLKPDTLGNGQKIEQDMAQVLGVKIFHVYRPRHGAWPADFVKRHVDEVVAVVQQWYEKGCRDMSTCSIRPTYK